MERFKNRWAYGLAAGLAAAATIPLYLIVIGLTELDPLIWVGIFDKKEETNAFLRAMIFFAVAATISGVLLFPSGYRNRNTMALRGIAVVGLSLFLAPILFGIFTIISNSGPYDRFGTLILFSFVFVLIGSVLSLGVPYIIAILISLWFAEDIDDVS